MKEGLLGGTLSVSSGRPTLIQHGSHSLEMAEALTNVVKHRRIETPGGRLRIESTDGDGMVLAARLPLSTRRPRGSDAR
jgi:hypothetical protein